MPPLPPPTETFWDRYSPNREFPIAQLLALVVVVGVACSFFIYTGAIWRRSEPIVSPPMRGIVVVADVPSVTPAGGSGDDGPKQEAVPVEASQPTPTKPLTETRLNDVRANVSAVVPELAQASAVLPSIAGSPNWDKFAQADADIRKRLLGGSGTGNGTKTGPGTGNDSGPKPSTAEIFADSSAGRALRWVIQFNTKSGSDYLRQLTALRAMLVFPLPDGDRLVIRDLANPGAAERMSKAKFEAMPLPSQGYSDDDGESAVRIAQTLGLPFRPRLFYAFLPEETETAMATMEKSYQGRLPSRIAETRFAVSMRNGTPDIRVVGQFVK